MNSESPLSEDLAANSADSSDTHQMPGPDLYRTGQTRLEMIEFSQTAELGTNLSRGIQMLKHYRWSQIAERIKLKITSRLGRKWQPQPVPFDAITVSPETLEQIKKIHAARCLSFDKKLPMDPESIRDGNLTLLNETVNVGFPFDWRCANTPDVSHLWRFQLHYHEFLDQISPSDDRADLTMEILDDWIQTNAPLSQMVFSDAWHPYCISRRISVWLCILADVNLDSAFRNRLLESLHAQAEFLFNHLERDLLGNHFFENLFSLQLYCCVCESNATLVWQPQIQEMLIREARLQVLPHGEHFERSPMYHSQVLAGLLKLMIACKPKFPLVVEACYPVARNMLLFLVDLLHPDGEIPLFADSCFNECPGVDEIVALAEHAGLGEEILSQPPEFKSLAAGPYWNWRHGGDCIIWDVGKVGAKELPAHAHCDLLNFEGSIAGRRWIVDSGTFDYGGDSMRSYCRSSAAHNVVTIDNQDHCEIWSKFRMGNRGEPTRFESGENNSTQWAFAQHDAYKKRFGIDVQRMMSAKACEYWVCAERVITKPGQRTTQGAALNSRGHLHLAPGIEIQCVSKSNMLLIFGDEKRELSFFGTTPQIVQGWYCPEFGVRLPSLVIIYECETRFESLFGWVLNLANSQSDNRRFQYELAFPEPDSQAGQVELLTENQSIFSWNFNQ